MSRLFLSRNIENGNGRAGCPPCVKGGDGVYSCPTPWDSATLPGSRMVANGNNTGGGYRSPMGGSGMVSGVNPDDYDIPTFFRNAD